MKLDWRIVLAFVLAWYSLGSVDGCRLPDVLPIPPAPQPDRLEGKAWLIVVEETEERSASLAAVMRDKGFQDRIATDDVHFRVYDDDGEPGSKYAQDLGGKVPGYLLIDDAGKVYSLGELPSEFTSEFFNGVLREFGR